MIMFAYDVVRDAFDEVEKRGFTKEEFNNIVLMRDFIIENHKPSSVTKNNIMGLCDVLESCDGCIFNCSSSSCDIPSDSSITTNQEIIDCINDLIEADKKTNQEIIKCINDLIENNKEVHEEEQSINKDIMELEKKIEKLKKLQKEAQKLGYKLIKI